MMGRGAPQRFSAWRPTTREGSSDAPAGPAVVQIKARDRLRTYPRGMSAMLWYGAFERCATSLGPVLDAAARATSDDMVVWRVLSTPHPGRELARLLEAFERRFGAPPKLQRAVE